MYELIPVGKATYYIDSPVKVGVYAPDPANVILIDSGSDKDAGRKIRQILQQQGWNLKAIINTHSHADHIGGNRYLQSQTGCTVFANGMEVDFTRHPVLEPSFLYGGYPMQALRHKFLMAQSSDVKTFTHPDFPKELTVIPLPGHSFDMVGIRTPDDIIFLADCVSSEATLEKYGIPFLYDVQAQLDTLTAIQAIHGSMFIPAHAPATADIAPLAKLNHEKMLAIGETLLSFCGEPVTFDALLQQVFTHYNLSMSMIQHVLVGSTVRSFLAWLTDTGKLRYTFTDNQLCWVRT